MSRFLSIIEAVAEIALWLLERLDANRAADFRRRVAGDAVGVLLEQINPAGSRETIHASTDQRKGGDA